MDWAQILVIILAIFLALFLFVGIALVVLLIRLTQQIRAITATAQRTASGIEQAVQGAAKMGVLSSIIKFGVKQAVRVKGKKRR